MPFEMITMRTGDGAEYGPVSRDKLLAWYDEGRVPADAVMVDSATGESISAGDFLARLATIGETSAPASPTPETTVQQAPEPGPEAQVEPAGGLFLQLPDGEQYGPITQQELLEWYQEGRVPLEAVVLDRETGETRPVSELLSVPVWQSQPEPAPAQPTGEAFTPSRVVVRTPDGQEYGPITYDEYLQWWSEGRIPEGTQVVDASQGVERYAPCPTCGRPYRLINDDLSKPINCHVCGRKFTPDERTVTTQPREAAAPVRPRITTTRKPAARPLAPWIPLASLGVVLVLGGALLFVRHRPSTTTPPPRPRSSNASMQPGDRVVSPAPTPGATDAYGNQAPGQPQGTGSPSLPGASAEGGAARPDAGTRAPDPFAQPPEAGQPTPPAPETQTRPQPATINPVPQPAPAPEPATPAPGPRVSLQAQQEALRYVDEATACLARRDKRAAMTALISAINLDPQCLPAHFKMAWLAWDMGNRTLARREFETVIALAPNSSQAAESRRALRSLPR